MQFFRVKKRNPCKVCNHEDWCGISEDGTVAICMREESNRQSKNGGFVHFLGDSQQSKKCAKPIPPTPVIDGNKIAPASRLDRVYSEFLSRLVLTRDHRKLLHDRGLGDVAIGLHNYRSMPTGGFAAAISRQLDRAGFVLEGVPGFYKNQNGWQFIDYKKASGFLIPIRNENLQIVGLSLRRDDARKPKYLMISSSWLASGTKSGTPHHFAIVGQLKSRAETEEIIVTEGALKANIIGDLAGVPVIGLVSTTTHDDDFPALLKKVYPNLKNVRIAFDQEKFDAKKPTTCAFVHVARQRERIISTLEKNDLRCEILYWSPDCKGLDDYLNKKSNSEILTTA